MSGLLFHLITFPYVSRILLADGIGIIQFYQSIINYIALLTTIGIPFYAVREIARVRDDSIKCSVITIEILLLHILLTIVGYLIVFILICSVSRVQVNPALFLLLSCHLILSAIGAYWFYQGIEDFKYIAIRALIVRVLSLIALFVFVKEREDILIYAAIIVLAEAGNNIYNFVRLHKFIKLPSGFLSVFHPFRHLKPALKIFVLNLVISIYVNLDTVMLGFMKNDAIVGYYAASSRITKSILSIVQSLGGVLLPRLSNYAETQQLGSLQQLSKKSLGFILAFSLPLTVLVIFMATPLIHLFCGSNFDPAILTIQIMAPIILFIAVSNLAGPQILYAIGKENLVIRATLFGAFVNVLLNISLIPHFNQLGAGLATVVAEFVVMLLMIKFVNKYILLNCFSSENKNYYYATIILAVLLGMSSILISEEYLYCIIGSSVSIIAYISFLFYRKDPVLEPLLSFLKNNRFVERKL